jgi:hypothetical protein
MFQQFTQLSLEADGRFANDHELQFLDTYLATVPVRLSVYEKLRDSIDAILDDVEDQMQRKVGQVLRTPSRDMTSIWRRDVKITLRHATAALLVNDLERFKDCFLLWHRTIVQSFKTEEASAATYATMPKVLEKYLTPEELAFIVPLLRLAESTLG